MNKKIYYNDLYDYYKDLLTNKQRNYFEDYYFADLSLSEISENEDVSRNAVHNQLKIVLERLDYYEDKLHLYENSIKIKKLIENVDSDLRKKIEELI